MGTMGVCAGAREVSTYGGAIALLGNGISTMLVGKQVSARSQPSDHVPVTAAIETRVA
jgi:hypothetical protein